MPNYSPPKLEWVYAASGTTATDIGRWVPTTSLILSKIIQLKSTLETRFLAIH
jgi:hypothetical protein